MHRLVILTTKKLVVVDLRTIQVVNQFTDLQLNQSTLALISNFDMDIRPIIVTQGKPGMGIELKDIADSGL